jgi:hypothetical protein
LENAPTCRVVCPDAEGRVPVLYLLHGQGDTEEDWLGEKGQLETLLDDLKAPAMCLVMPFCGNARTKSGEHGSDFRELSLLLKYPIDLKELRRTIGPMR